MLSFLCNNKALNVFGQALIIRLETGKGQPEAMALYKKAGYSVIPKYGPYKKLANSVCMEKGI